MDNKLAAVFVKKLTATFTIKASDEMVKTYTWGASDYELSKEQWQSVLKTLMNDNISGYAIPWPVVKEAIEREISSTKDNNKAWQYFRIDGRGFKVRVEYIDGAWINASVKIKDSNGQLKEIGYRVGEVFRLPDGATHAKLEPDRPADPDPRCIPGEIEVSGFVADIVRKLGGKMKMPVDVPF